MDKNNPFVVEAFSDYGEVRALNTLEFTREAVREAEALVIRSETKITNQLLQESRVRFVGSATIGTDHVDESYLAQR
ncbi:MAG: erythronate-4-phosphate dehydrogenase, partial [Thermoleophilia bacterium]|nr:erythronate-4-phosphate dehydrogenase [Thermoleophilia bacterium]